MTAVIKLMTGLTRAATNPKNACVTRMESAPVSGAVIKKDKQDERDAPFFRISADDGHDRATAKRDGHADSRAGAHGFQVVVAQPLENGVARNQDVDQSGKK